jgi:glycerophosphoryl diester phosphodiesterase
LAAAAVAAIAALIWLLLPGNPDPKDGIIEDSPPPTATATEPPKLGGPDAPLVLAHRGGDEEFAWQTIPAFQHAARLGAHIETDVRWTKDGVAVLVHDAGTTPGMECEGGNLVVAKTDSSVLRDRCRSAAGASTNGKRYPIPTFAEGVAAVAKVPGAQIFAEVKVDQGARQNRHFVETIKNARMIDRAVVTSDTPDRLAEIRAEAEAQGEGDLRTMLFVSGARPSAAQLSDQGLWGVAVKEDIISKAYVKRLQDQGLKVMMWIVNTPQLWEQADDVGADLILTDKPAAYGKWAKIN